MADPRKALTSSSPRRTHKLILNDDPSLVLEEETNRSIGSEGKEFKAGLARVLAASQQYADAGKEFSRCGAMLADEIDAFGSSEWGAQHCADVMREIAKIIRNTAALQDRTMGSVHDALDMPVFQLLEIEQLELRQLAEARNRADEELAAAASRNKRKGAQVTDVTPLEHAVELRQSEYETQSAILDGAKKIKMFRFMRSLLQATKGYFNSGAEVMSGFSPHMEELDVKLSELEIAQGKRCKDGYVWKLSHKQQGRWKRVWIVLRNGWLEVRSDSVKRTKNVTDRNKMNLLISTVKIPMVKHSSGGDEKFEFEIVSPERKKPWILASRTEAERQEWIDALQASIGSLINNQQLSSGHDAKKGAAAGKGGIGMAIVRKVIPKGHRKTRSTAGADNARQLAMQLMQEGAGEAVMMELGLVHGNEVCADCSKADPEWASMNLGSVFCLNCSGIHRHLGSHITKVRSLTMDKWPPWTLEYMRCIGNARSNAFWEANLTVEDEARIKPKPGSSQQERTDFITAKYATRQFAVASPHHDRPALNIALFETIGALEVDLTTLVGSASGVPPLPTKSRSSRTTREGSPTSELLEGARNSDSVAKRFSGGGTNTAHNSPAVPRVVYSASESDLMAPTPAIPYVSSPLKQPEVFDTPPMARHGVGRSSTDSFDMEELLLANRERLAELLLPIYRLLCWGADLNAVDSTTNRTLLQTLLWKRDAFLLHLFLVHGLEPSTVDEAGDNVLHYSARYNLFECLEVLFTALAGQLGSALRARNAAGLTPSEIARAESSQRTLELLLAREVVTTPPANGSPGGIGGASASPVSAEGVGTRNSSAESSVDDAAAGRRSPRGSSIDAIPAASNPSMVKKFINKATGGHARSKSTFQAPTHQGRGEQPVVPRDTMMGKLSSTLRTGRLHESKRGRTPHMSAKGTGPEDAFAQGIDDTLEEEPSVSTPVTPLQRSLLSGSARGSTRAGSSPSFDEGLTRQSSQSVDLGQEVQVAGKKAPLMKAAKLTSDRGAIAAAVREARATSVSAERETDVMAFISSEGNDSDDDSMHVVGE